MTAHYFGKYLNDIVQKLNSTTENLELEVRYQQKDSKISFSTFSKIKNILTTRYGQPEVIHSSDVKLGMLRQTIQDNKNGTTTYININKKPIGSPIIDDNLRIKVDVSSETSIEASKPIENPDITRVKHRYSWKIPSENVQFDLTEVDEKVRNAATESRREIEIELLSPLLEFRNNPLKNEEIEELNRQLTKLTYYTLYMKTLIQESDNVYTTKDLYTVVKFFNESLYKLAGRSNVPYNRLSENVAAQAQNIKINNMKYKDLFNTEEKCYSVTVKADGMRKFLIIHDTGIWLAYNDSFCLVERNVPPSWKQYTGTIFDGEDVNLESRFRYKNAKHYYLPFDVLLYKNQEIFDKPLKERLEYTRSIRNLGPIFNRSNVPLIIVEEKPFYFFDIESNNFYECMNEIYTNSRETKNYENDGFIFTPNTRYRRAHSKDPYIYKWKPFDQLTMDFAYAITTTKRALYASDGDKLVEFKGVEDFPFDAEKQVDWFDTLFNKIKDTKVIIEFEPKMVDGKPFKIDGNFVLKPKKIRSDKNRPNGVRTVSDIWKDINLPVTLNTMLGNDTELLRKYHNVIKRNIFNEIPKGSYLIDIGSGNGGDLSKFNNFDKVLCIEPNKVFFAEFNRRLIEMDTKTQSKIHTLFSGGEETEKIMKKVKEVFESGFIVNNKRVPLYISMMLTMSFFFSQDGEMLNKLVNTINSIRNYYYKNIIEGLNIKDAPDLKLIFLTIEKDRELKLLEKYNNEIHFPGWEMKYDKVNKVVYINIPGSIVENQTEYLVDLQLLKNRLYGEFDYLSEANGNVFMLTDYQKELSSMYVYGSMNLPFVIS